MSGLEVIYKYLPDRIENALKNCDICTRNSITEIRIRKSRELIPVINNRSCFIDESGRIYGIPDSRCIKITPEEFEKIFMEMCSYSVYSKEEELKKGYISLDYGARAGIASEAVNSENELKSIKNISSINLRIPRAVNGCADRVLDSVYKGDGLPGIIVAGLPNSGKTTLLRDVGVQLSSGYNGFYRKIVFIDERLEFFGNGTEKHIDIGINCDIISGFPKANGIENATRSLSPEMIICDEISTKKELNSIKFAFSTGVSTALSVHSGSIEELIRNEIVKDLYSYGYFSYVVMFKGHSFNYEIFSIDEVFNENGGCIAVDILNNGNGNIIFNENKKKDRNM